MPWNSTHVSDQRIQFAVLASRKQHSLAELCRQFGISRQTGHLWLKRFQQGGLDAVKEVSRRPHSSPARITGPIVECILALRRQRPDGGAEKLAHVLRAQHPELPVISISSVHRILERHGLIADRDRHPHAVQRFERTQPNELWQMDFKGPLGYRQCVGPLSILDDHSRYVVLLKQVGSTQLQPVRVAMQEAFQHAGLPECLLVDHGVPWWNAASPTGWTELTVWILRQGIRITHSAIRHRQTQGKVERMHGALQRAVHRRPHGLIDQQWLDEFRYEYNHVRPHAALRLETPASRWQCSPRRFDPQPPEWAYGAGLEVVRLSREGQLHWRGRRWEISRALRFQRVGLQIVGERVLIWFCHTVVREISLGSGARSSLQGNSF